MKTQGTNLRVNGNRVRAAIGLASMAAVSVVLLGLRSAGSAKPDDSAAVPAAVKVLNNSTLQLSAGALADLGTVKAADRNFPETLGLTGSISPVENQVSVVPARVAGRIDRVLKVTGETVRLGEPLALMVSPDYLSAKEEYLQILKRDQGTAGGASAAADDLSGFASLARKKLEMMGLSAADIAALPGNVGDDHLVIRATRDGVITSVNTVVGSMQNQGDTLFTTSNLDRVWFSGDLYIEDLPKVRTGQKILISAEGQDRPLGGTISFISPVVDAGARTVKVRAIIDNPGHLLRASMFVQGNLVLRDDSALVIPRAAILKMDDRTYCFRSLGQNRFQEVPVTVSRQDDNLAAITGGLATGDEIVAKDCATLDRALDSGRARD